MRIPAPVHGMLKEARYVETHQGFPFTMQMFMAFSRLATYMIFVIALEFLPEMIGTIIFIPITFTFSLAYTKFDIYSRFGFIIFHRLLGKFWW